METYTKEELIAIVRNLNTAVECLEKVEGSLHSDDYNSRNGYSKFLTQARNYLRDYKAILGDKLLEDVFIAKGE